MGNPSPSPIMHKPGLPIILTTPGLSNCPEFCAATGILTPDSAPSLSPCAPIRLHQNLTPSQRIKLILHERCNHKNWKVINQWIRNGYFQVNKFIANSEDPICTA